MTSVVSGTPLPIIRTQRVLHAEEARRDSLGLQAPSNKYSLIPRT
jgi:hypothetical protein